MDKLTERELSYLEEAAINLEGAAQFLDFKTGIDVAFTLLGLEPVYGILPDDSKAEKKKKLFRGF